MTMSEQQTELNELATQLACLSEGDTVILLTDNGSLAATVTVNRWCSDGAVIVFEDRDVARRIHVYTEHYNGWLDPLVDIDDTDKSRRDSYLPFGSLIDVCPVSSGISEFYEPVGSDEHGESSKQSFPTRSADEPAEATPTKTDDRSSG